MDAPPPSYACHCLDCQTSSGSALAQNRLLATEAIATAGPPVCFGYRTGTGSVLSQCHCSDCGTGISNTHLRLLGPIVLRAGTLDESGSIMPVAHIRVARMQPWLMLPDGVPRRTEGPPPEEIAAILR